VASYAKQRDPASGSSLRCGRIGPRSLQFHLRCYKRLPNKFERIRNSRGRLPFLRHGISSSSQADPAHAGDGRRLLGEHQESFMPEFISMNFMMAGMAPVMSFLMMGRGAILGGDVAGCNGGLVRGWEFQRASKPRYSSPFVDCRSQRLQAPAWA
jgi:hypothetical protein